MTRRVGARAQGGAGRYGYKNEAASHHQPRGGVDQVQLEKKVASVVIRNEAVAA